MGTFIPNYSHLLGLQPLVILINNTTSIDDKVTLITRYYVLINTTYIHHLN